MPPALQVDSLPAKAPGKPTSNFTSYKLLVCTLGLHGGHRHPETRCQIVGLGAFFMGRCVVSRGPVTPQVYNPSFPNPPFLSKDHANLASSPTGPSELPPRAPLVVQWLRAHLKMQETRVRSLVREGPTCRTAEPVPPTTEPVPETRELKLLQPEHPEPVPRNKRGPCSERPAPHS